MFTTSYMSKYGTRRRGYFIFEFAIYKEAHWDMFIHFFQRDAYVGRR